MILAKKKSIIPVLLCLLSTNLMAKKDYFGKRKKLSPFAVALYSNSFFTMNNDYNSGIDNLVTLARVNGYPVLKKKPANFATGFGIKVRSFLTYTKKLNWLGFELAGSYNFMEPTGYGYIPLNNENLTEVYNFDSRTSINTEFNVLLNFFSEKAVFMHFGIGGTFAIETLQLNVDIANVKNSYTFTGKGFGGLASYIIEYRFATNISFELGFSFIYLPISNWSNSGGQEFSKNTLLVGDNTANLYKPLAVGSGEEPLWNQTGVRFYIALNYIL